MRGTDDKKKKTLAFLESRSAKQAGQKTFARPMSNIAKLRLASGLRGINKRNELVITPLNFNAIPFVLFPSKKYEF